MPKAPHSLENFPADNNDIEPASSEHRRAIRSFVLRAGRLSPAQERALNTLLPAHGIPFSKSPLSSDTLFEKKQPTVLEIGFGMGNATAYIAAHCPQLNFIGIEVHTPGVGSLLNQIENLGLTNLKIIQHDAVEVLAHMIPPASLHGIHLFFPDPWHKKRHHKRRIVQTAFLDQIARCLEPGGYVHFATDWEHYAHWMLEHLQQHPLFENTAPDHSFSTRPDYRPITKFETRGLKLGHGVWDIIFRLKK
ncbi:MAG: tRNA (guanosine(46)-N7)-methyltransferase TrmB [Pseudomonadota bacterium]